MPEACTCSSFALPGSHTSILCRSLQEGAGQSEEQTHAQHRWGDCRKVLVSQSQTGAAQWPEEVPTPSVGRFGMFIHLSKGACFLVLGCSWAPVAGCSPSFPRMTHSQVHPTAWMMDCNRPDAAPDPAPPWRGSSGAGSASDALMARRHAFQDWVKGKGALGTKDVTPHL